MCALTLLMSRDLPCRDDSSVEAWARPMSWRSADGLPTIEPDANRSGNHAASSHVGRDIKNASIRDALVGLLGKSIAGPAPSASPPPSTPTATVPTTRGGSSPDENQKRRCANWAGSRWECWSSRRCPASMRALGPHGPGDRRPPGGGRRSHVPVPLDARVRTGRPAAVAPRHGLCRTQRREHGDDPQDRGGLRRLEAAHWWRRRDAGLVDFSIFPHRQEDLPSTSWPTRNDGPPTCRRRPTRSTIRPPSW